MISPRTLAAIVIAAAIMLPQALLVNSHTTPLAVLNTTATGVQRAIHDDPFSFQT